MFIARIDGCITSTVKHKSLVGYRLLVAQRLELDGKPSGEPQVVLDILGAGRGSQVMITSDGDLARQTLNDNTTPSRFFVVGIIDTVTIEGTENGAKIT
jgi:ethanolamine utilization protein EutN